MCLKDFARIQREVSETFFHLISMRREFNLASGGSLNLTLLCMPMYMLEIQVENIFSKDFLNNFLEVIFKIFYFYISIHIYVYIQYISIIQIAAQLSKVLGTVHSR